MKPRSAVVQIICRGYRPGKNGVDPDQFQPRFGLRAGETIDHIPVAMKLAISIPVTGDSHIDGL